MNRYDAETILFAVSTAGLVMFVNLSRGLPPDRVFFLGCMTLLLIPTYVYGSRVLGRTLPENARALVEFGSIVSWRGAPAVQAGERQDDAGGPAVDESLTLEDQWRAELRRFLLARKVCGSFAIREMAYDKREHGRVVRRKFVTDTGWRRFMDVLQDSKEHTDSPTGIVVRGPNGMEYAPGYGYARACRHVQAGPLQLPTDDRGNLVPPPRVYI